MDEVLINTTVKSHGVTITLIVIVCCFLLLTINTPYIITSQVRIIHLNNECLMEKLDTCHVSIGDSLSVTIESSVYHFIIEEITPDNLLKLTGDDYSTLPLINQGIIEMGRTTFFEHIWSLIVNRSKHVLDI